MQDTTNYYISLSEAIDTFETSAPNLLAMVNKALLKVEFIDAEGELTFSMDEITDLKIFYPHLF